MVFRVLLARLYRQQGRQDRAVATLEPALRLAAKEGYVRVFVEAGKSLLPVLRQCMEQDIVPDYAARLLAVFHAEGMFPAEKSESDLPRVQTLSERELEVLRLMSVGLSNPQIAEQLFITVGTVKRHVHNIFLKLEVSNRRDAIAHVHELDVRTM